MMFDIDLPPLLLLKVYRTKMLEAFNNVQILSLNLNENIYCVV